MEELLVGAVVVLGAMTIVLIVVTARRCKLRGQPRHPQPAVEASRPAPATPRSMSLQPPLKRRLPGVAATDAYAVVPQRSPNVWFLVPPKTMDFSDTD